MAKEETKPVPEAEAKAKEKAEEDAAAEPFDAKQKAFNDDEMKRPLSTEERTELRDLEKQANQCRYQPDPPSMLKLGKLRVRAKLPAKK